MPEWARQIESRILQGKPTLLDSLWCKPETLLSRAAMQPDLWQVEMLRSSAERIILLCSRQVGKSQTSAALALQTSLCQPGALILLVSPTLRQSGELFRQKLLSLYDANARPVKAARETALELVLTNGSRIVSLPGADGTIRGYSGVDLLVIDEAARVPDSVYFAVRPMLAVSGGRLVLLSSAYWEMGFFHETWRHGGEGWHRVKVTAEECPRISRDFLAEEKDAMGQRLYDREYRCVFSSGDDAVFDYDAIQRAMTTPASGPALF